MYVCMCVLLEYLEHKYHHCDKKLARVVFELALYHINI